MSLLYKPEEVRACIKQYADQRISMPCFCAENSFTMEGILNGAQRIANQIGRNVTIYIAVTANYPGRQQLKNYTSLDSIEEGFWAFRSDLQRLGRAGGPFNNVNIIPSLDHGQPKLDDWLFEEGKGFWGCVMYDCSTWPMNENRKMTGEFVNRHKNEYIIEGCVDEITESGSGDMKLTNSQDAKKFLDETGVDLIVVNLGTEHRATTAQLRYHSDIAKNIYAQSGYKLVLHGTSSLSQQDLQVLRYDGIAKVNIWTVLETRTREDFSVHKTKMSR